MKITGMINYYGAQGVCQHCGTVYELEPQDSVLKWEYDAGMGWLFAVRCINCENQFLCAKKWTGAPDDWLWRINL